MTANLIQPRVRVLWGKVNLSAYDGNIAGFPKGSPVVYDVEVHLQAETEGPTASMKWDPTGPGMAVYESFISSEEYMLTQITIEIFYPRGKSIVFPFIWTGQTISYGNDMSIIVKMQSELAGLINATIRSTAQADGDKGMSAMSMIERAKKQFGLEGYKNLVRYTDRAKKDLERAKLLTSYGNEWTFGANIANIGTQTGNVVFANNIKEANLVFFTPFSWDKTGKVENAATAIGPSSPPDPATRYGYILGPSLINSLSRTTEWKPPQQTKDNKPQRQPTARKKPDKKDNTRTPPAAPQAQSSQQGSKPTTSPIGVSGGRANPGIANKDNPDAVDKQNALQDEKEATLSLQTFLTPVLVGIKPHDIIYLPSLKGNFIEDWIVQSVDYDQSDGKVQVSISGTRIYGSADPMNKFAAETFKTFAITNGLIGPNATMEAWEKYAWGLPI